MSERPDPFEMSQEERDKIIAWLRSNDIDPSDIVADGKFTVHDDYVTGNRFLRDKDGKHLIYKNRPAAVHFKKHVKGNWR